MNLPDLNAPVGVFDSGIGGLSVLRALRAALPLERFVYYSDSAHAPYGEKGDAFVLERSMFITETLVREHGIKALVVACNTATAAAIAPLRSNHGEFIIVGIEPALKPAAAASQSKCVGVLATRGTLASDKFKILLAAQSAHAQFTCHPCDGLAEVIETNLADLNSPAIYSEVERHLKAVGLLDATSLIDTLVLGCTHYPLIKKVFEHFLAPTVRIIDNGAGVANRLSLRLIEKNLAQIKTPSEPLVQFLSSASRSPQSNTLLA